MDTYDYLRRIGYGGPVAPTAATLRAIHRAHLCSVPFENLDIHRGVPIRLTPYPGALFDKIVSRRRGGFCYEVNGLFAWLLEELGFEVTLLSARDAQADGGFGLEFDHLTLQVLCPGDPAAPARPWLADVGWGDSFNEPLRLDLPDVEQPEGLRSYRLVSHDGYQVLWQRGYDGSWEGQYRFDLRPRQLSDFESMCRYHQTSPLSSFTQRRVCTMATENGRMTLSESKLSVTERGQKQDIAVSAGEYQTVLAERFGILL
jgi:N-hydroxyarylamine O-acetyltransferase